MSDFLPPLPDRMISCQRTLQVPVQMVYRAWTEPQELMRWWGPHGFHNTLIEHHPEPGGAWRFIMHGADGTSYPNECAYVWLETNRRIVWNHLNPPVFQGEALFEEMDKAQTLLTFRMLFHTPANCEAVKKYAVGKNEENLDRLEVVLRELQEK